MLSTLCSLNARMGTPLDRKQLRDMQKLTEASKLVLEWSYEEFVKTDPGCPLLHIYGNDGTPTRVKVRVSLKHGDGRVHRTGHKGTELLVQACFCRKRVAGILETACRLIDPLPMSHGKGAHATFSCCFRAWKALRAYGHRGIAIEFKIFDRALLQALDNAFRQYHFDRHMRAMSDNVALLYLCEWPITVPCVLHDLQNAQKWALYQWISDASLMKDVHIGIESLSNGYDLIIAYLPAWLSERVCFKPVS